MKITREFLRRVIAEELQREVDSSGEMNSIVKELEFIAEKLSEINKNEYDFKGLQGKNPIPDLGNMFKQHADFMKVTPPGSPNSKTLVSGLTKIFGYLENMIGDQSVQQANAYYKDPTNAARGLGMFYARNLAVGNDALEPFPPESRKKLLDRIKALYAV
jgi:hypothetical protein